MRFSGYTGFFVSAAAKGATGAQDFTGFTGYVDTPNPLIRATLPDFGDTRIHEVFGIHEVRGRDYAPSAEAVTPFRALLFRGGTPCGNPQWVLSISQVVFAAPPSCSLRVPPCCRLAPAMVGGAAKVRYTGRNY
jgi:hypothetical protein